MTSTHHNPSNFWFGFVVGGLSLAAVAFLLGTKKGRAVLKQAIDYAENHEFGSDEFLKLLDLMIKMAKKEAGDSEIGSYIPSTASVESLMSKMKDASDEKKKKFFIKN